MRSTFSIDGVELDQFPAWVVNDNQTLHGPSSISMAQVQLPNTPGEVALPGTIQAGAMDFVLHMTVFGHTYDQMDDNLTRLYALTAPPNRMVNITETMPSGQWRTASAQLTSAPIGRPWFSDEDGVDVELVFRIPSGVWLGPEVTTPLTGRGVTSVHIDSLGGSAPMYDTRITVSGGDVDFQLSAGSDPNAYVGFRGNTGGTTTIWPRAAFSTNGDGGNNSVQIDTGTRTFYVPADGIFRVDFFSGVSSASLITRKAYY